MTAAQEQAPLIFKAICAVKNSISAIGKDRKNTQQGFMFRSIDQVYDELHPHMAEHNVFSVPRVLERIEQIYQSSSGGRMVRVALKTEYDFVTIDGSKITVGPVWGEGNDSADKATNKALTACHKCCLIQLLTIPTKDLVDGDAESPTLPPEAGSKQSDSKPSKPSTQAGKSAAKASQTKSASPAGSPSSSSKATDQQPLAEFVCSVGKKNKGKRLSDFGPADLQSFVTWLEERAVNSRRAMPKDEQEFCYFARKYLEEIGHHMPDTDDEPGE
jgi:hypothetical protein